MKEILKVPLVLATPAPPVPAEMFREGSGLKELVDEMVETMRAAHGVGLAAPQIGVGLRIAVVGVEDEVIILINPRISKAQYWREGVEGCLSLPGLEEVVNRPQEIVVWTQDVQGHLQERPLNGDLAIAVLHEIDHLNGVLITEASRRKTGEL